MDTYFKIGAISEKGYAEEKTLFKTKNAFKKFLLLYYGEYTFEVILHNLISSFHLYKWHTKCIFYYILYARAYISII